MIKHEVRAAIEALPGKTVQPWKDGDERCHCTHCDLCGRLFRTAEIGKHIDECQAALIAALERGVAKIRCKHANALVIIASPSPGVKAERWCPECGAHYGPTYTRKNGWKNRRQWHAPGGPTARAYVKLCEEVRANEKARKTEALKRFKESL